MKTCAASVLAGLLFLSIAAARAADEPAEGKWVPLFNGKNLDGWTVKDHLDHIAAWEKSLIALLDGSNRAAAMGISASGDAHA